MEELFLALLVIFTAITIIPLFAKRAKVPVIVTELLFGIIIGKSLLDIVPENQMIDFFASFGLIYLMFLAGLEVNFEKVRQFFSRTICIAAVSISVPFITGVLLSSYVGVHPLLLGTIFSTTSLGVILPLAPSLRKKHELWHTLLGSVVLVDIISMFLLAFSLALMQGSLKVSFIYSSVAIFVLFLVPWLMHNKGLHKRIEKWVSEESHFEMEVRFSFALIFILAAISGKLGFHSIIGAFIAGLILSELTPKSSVLESKLESFGYGFFIPLFFIFMGAKVDLPLLFSNLNNIKLLSIVVFAGIATKFIGVAIISKLRGMPLSESISFGFFHSARLSLIIAAVDIAFGIGLVDANLFSIFIILSIVSAIIGPSLGKYYFKK